jgi:putative CocE/NonD family hydrolase
MMAASPARERQRLVVGPWSHVNSRYPHSAYGGVEFGPDAALEMNEIHLAWCDYWLKGEPNAVMQSPPALLFETGTNQWRDANHWPLASGEWSLFLGWDGAEGSLAGSPSDEPQPDRSYRYDPGDPAPTQIDVKRYPIEDVPLVMNEVEARPDVIAYTSGPLAQP